VTELSPGTVEQRENTIINSIVQNHIENCRFLVIKYTSALYFKLGTTDVSMGGNMRTLELLQVLEN
jgi:hypothetical protein